MTLLGPQSRFGDKILGILVVRPPKRDCASKTSFVQGPLGIRVDNNLKKKCSCTSESESGTRYVLLVNPSVPLRSRVTPTPFFFLLFFLARTKNVRAYVRTPLSLSWRDASLSRRKRWGDQSQSIQLPSQKKAKKKEKWIDKHKRDD